MYYGVFEAMAMRTADGRSDGKHTVDFVFSKQDSKIWLFNGKKTSGT